MTVGECFPPLYTSFVSTVGQESLSVSRGPWALILVWWGGEECTCSANSGCIPCWWTGLKISNIDLGLRMTDQTRGYCDLSPQTEVITAVCYGRKQEGDREPPFPSAVCYLNFSLLFLTISYMYSTCHRRFFFLLCDSLGLTRTTPLGVDVTVHWAWAAADGSSVPLSQQLSVGEGLSSMRHFLICDWALMGPALCGPCVNGCPHPWSCFQNYHTEACLNYKCLVHSSGLLLGNSYA